MDFSKLNPPFTEKFLKTDFSKYVREDCEKSWAIDKNDFYKFQKHSNIYLWSTVFPKDNNANFKWQAYFSPCGRMEKEIKHASFYLCLNWRRIQIPVLTTIHFSVKENSGSVIMERYMYHKFKTYGGRGFPYFVESSELEELFVNTTSLIISVRISAQYEVSHFRFEQNLLDHYSNLLEDGSFSDVILYVEQDKTEFKVHRSILTCRSTVFASMFAHEMQENLTRRVVIKDFPSLVVKNLLNFLYCCKTEFESVDETLTLLEIADIYDVTDLKNQCVEYLVCNLNENNALSILLKSDMHALLDLKVTVLAYMQENKALFSDPTKYQILEVSPELMIEIETKIFNSKK